jgi:hypothetical protein
VGDLHPWGGSRLYPAKRRYLEHVGMPARKRLIAAGGTLRPIFMEPSGIARSAQMPLDIFVELIRRFRRLIY